LKNREDRGEAFFEYHGAELTVSGIVEIGRKPGEVKERVGHGQYEAFVRERLGWSASLALRYAQVFKAFKSVTVTDFDALQIDARSLYLLAAPSTPMYR
jgi:hypothetical protein